VLALGIAAAVGASVLYNTSIALQALEVRDVSHEHSLRPSLIGKLLRNRRWLGATALGLVGTPTFFVNGRAQETIQPAALDRAIREAKAR